MNEYVSLDFIIKLLDRHIESSRGAEHYAYNIIKQEILTALGIEVT